MGDLVEKGGISVVVPVFNSQKTLMELVDRLMKTLRDIDDEFEVILVNDGSSDRSWNMIEEIARSNPQVLGIDLDRNYGQSNAVVCGMAHSRYEILITMDDDLQHPPEEIPKLVKEASKGRFDVVYGRYQRDTWPKALGSGFSNLLCQWLFKKPGRVILSSFAAFTPSVVEMLIKKEDLKPGIYGMVLSVTTRIGDVPVEYHPRRSGVRGYGVKLLLKITLDNLLYSPIFSLFKIRSRGPAYTVRDYAGKIKQEKNN